MVLKADSGKKAEEKSEAKATSATSYDKMLKDILDEQKAQGEKLNTLKGDFERLCKSHGFVF